ncbi:hypothetical protein CYMTET_10341, partial [Cymbomonas tetramitiformis]
DFVLIIEMAILAVIQTYVFSSKEYRPNSQDGSSESRKPVKERLRNMFYIGDVVEDVRYLHGAAQSSAWQEKITQVHQGVKSRVRSMCNLQQASTSTEANIMKEPFLDGNISGDSSSSVNGEILMDVAQEDFERENNVVSSSSKVEPSRV